MEEAQSSCDMPSSRHTVAGNCAAKVLCHLLDAWLRLPRAAHMRQVICADIWDACFQIRPLPQAVSISESLMAVKKKSKWGGVYGH